MILSNDDKIVLDNVIEFCFVFKNQRFCFRKYYTRRQMWNDDQKEQLVNE
jgi:hypothetical protein